MNRSTVPIFLACLALVTPALARDPETLQPAPRAREGFIPERVDVSKLHPKPAAPRERRRLYERVEDDVDRGRGRVEDRLTYEIRRLQDDQDERLGRIQPQREAERLAEEYDRRRRLEAAAAAAPALPPGATAATADRSIVREPSPPGPGGSALARVVAEQEVLLDAAREGYQRDLRTAEEERDAAFRAARTDAERSVASRRFTERRAALTRGYQAYRRSVLGD